MSSLPTPFIAKSVIEKLRKKYGLRHPADAALRYPAELHHLRKRVEIEMYTLAKLPCVRVRMQALMAGVYVPQRPIILHLHLDGAALAGMVLAEIFRHRSLLPFVKEVHLSHYSRPLLEVGMEYLREAFPYAMVHRHDMLTPLPAPGSQMLYRRDALNISVIGEELCVPELEKELCATIQAVNAADADGILLCTAPFCSSRAIDIISALLSKAECITRIKRGRQAHLTHESAVSNCAIAIRISPHIPLSPIPLSAEQPETAKRRSSSEYAPGLQLQLACAPPILLSLITLCRRYFGSEAQIIVQPETLLSHTDLIILRSGTLPVVIRLLSEPLSVAAIRHSCERLRTARTEIARHLYPLSSGTSILVCEEEVSDLPIAEMKLLATTFADIAIVSLSSILDGELLSRVAPYTGITFPAEEIANRIAPAVHLENEDTEAADVCALRTSTLHTGSRLLARLGSLACTASIYGSVLVVVPGPADISAVRQSLEAQQCFYNPASIAIVWHEEIRHVIAIRRPFAINTPEESPDRMMAAEPEPEYGKTPDADRDTLMIYRAQLLTPSEIQALSKTFLKQGGALHLFTDVPEIDSYKELCEQVANQEDEASDALRLLGQELLSTAQELSAGNKDLMLRAAWKDSEQVQICVDPNREAELLAGKCLELVRSSDYAPEQTVIAATDIQLLRRMQHAIEHSRSIYHKQRAKRGISLTPSRAMINARRRLNPDYEEYDEHRLHHLCPFPYTPASATFLTTSELTRFQGLSGAALHHAARRATIGKLSTYDPHRHQSALLLAHAEHLAAVPRQHIIMLIDNSSPDLPSTLTALRQATIHPRSRLTILFYGSGEEVSSLFPPVPSGSFRFLPPL